MLGMTLGLAALSAWGVEHFGVLIADLQFPIPQVGEAAEVSQARLEAYNSQLSQAGLSLFHNFFRVAAVVSLLAVIPAALMRGGMTQSKK